MIGGYAVPMAEFEAERRLPAGADEVFRLVSDLDRSHEWLPAEVSLHQGEGDEVRADVDGVADLKGLARVRPEQLRVEWGSEDSPDYAGWLQVMHADEGHSTVVMHLSFFGDRPQAHGGAQAAAVRRQLDDALARLDRILAG